MKKLMMISLVCIGLFFAGILGCAVFQTSDLEGTWHMYMFETNSAGSSYHAHGSFTVDESGNVTEGTYNPPLGAGIPVVGGKVSLDPDGLLSGSIIAKGGITVTFTSGKLNADKNILAFVTDVSNGSMDLGVAMKDGGSFSKSDLEGTWHMYMFETNIAGSSYHSHGSFTVNKSGKVTKGTYLPPGGAASIPVVGGMVSLDPGGLFAGSILAQGGITVTFRSGKLDADKNILAYVSMVPSMAMELGVAMKDEASFSTSDLEGTWHMYMFETNPDAGPYYAHGTFTVDESGTITEATYIPAGGPIINAQGGNMNLDPEGLLSGSIVIVEDLLTVDFTSGKLDPDKNILTYVTNVSNGSMDFGVAVKAGLPQSSEGT